MTQIQSDQTKIALVSLNIENIKSDIFEIKTGIKELGGVFATKEELKEVSNKVTAIDVLATRVSLLENNKSFLQGGWKTITIVAGVMIAVVALVLNVIRLFNLNS